MVTVIVTLLRRYRAELAELAGASTIVVALAQWDGRIGAVAAGAAMLAKSMEWGLEPPKPPGRDR